MNLVRKKNVPGMFAKWESRSLHVLGYVLLFASLLLIPSTALAIYSGESFDAYIWPMMIGLVISIFLIALFKNPQTMRSVDGLLMMTILWFALFLFGTLPYMISGMNFVDALFESVSGFSTCGATIMSDIESWPHSLLLWRAMTHWIGGIIIVIMFMFIIPMVVSGGRGLLKNEMSGSGPSNLYVKMGNAAKQFIGVYVVLTTIFAIILVLMGVSILNSVTIAMSVISTGGFMNTNDSIDSFAWFVKLAIIAFMAISATNFYLHFRAVVHREIGGYKRDEEFKVMVSWVLLLSLMICILMYFTGDWGTTERSGFENMIDVIFTVSSLSSTTGFTTIDYYTYWPFLGVSILIMVMFVGGSAGSTAGGIKVSRAIVVVKAMINEVRQAVHPNAIYSVKYNNEGLSDDAVHGALAVVIMFALTAVVSSAVFNLVMTMEEAVFTSISLMSGTGPGTGDYFAGFSTLPGWAKLFACFVMYLGRMEVVAALVMVLPGFWKEVFGPAKIRMMHDKAIKVAQNIKVGNINNNVTDKDEPSEEIIDTTNGQKESVPEETSQPDKVSKDDGPEKYL